MTLSKPLLLADFLKEYRRFVNSGKMKYLDDDGTIKVFKFSSDERKMLNRMIEDCERGFRP